MQLELDLERRINDTLTSGVAGEAPTAEGKQSSLPSPSASSEVVDASAADAAADAAAIAELVSSANADMSVRINNYERLFACAEHLAAAKKQVDELVKDEASLPAAEWPAQKQKISQLKIAMGRICMQMSEELGITVPEMNPVHAEETLIPLIYRCIPRDTASQLLSIGSIPHFCGEACVGPCRFHRKGKCFDGPLCRFCHMDGTHPGAVKKVPKKSRKMKKFSPKRDAMGMPMPDSEMGGNQNALAALFAALDVSTDDPRNADPYFPPYGFDPYAQHYDMGYDNPPYMRDGPPAYPGAYPHGFQPWANGGVPLIY
jgi:hypothetical protein